MKISTIQKRNNLNEVERVGKVGPGGAYHAYLVRFSSAKVESNAMAKGGEVIEFQKGPRNEPDSVCGVLDGDLLEIVRDRLACFQKGEYFTRENAIALTHIEEALLWMAKRADDRAERNVLGTTQK